MKVNFLTSKLTVKRTLVSLSLWLATAMPHPGYAETVEAISEIRRVAEQFALTQIDRSGLSDIEASAGAMDSRLRLKDCDVALEAFGTGNGNNRNLTRTTVGVRCTGSSPWTLYVPVTIDAMKAALYTARPLLRGEMLDDSAIEVRRIPVSKLPPNSLGSADDLGNMETVRPLKAGVPLTLNALKARQVVRQGQEVVIVAAGNGISVKMTGKAMKSGSYGDLIPVRNSNSGRIIEAAIENEGTVVVNM
jgi:flagella basal body P-ring formation protein FlgA